MITEDSIERSRFSRGLLNEGHLSGRVVGERVDGNDHRYPERARDLDIRYKVGTPLLQQLQILFPVCWIERLTRDHLWSTAVHL